MRASTWLLVSLLLVPSVGRAGEGDASGRLDWEVDEAPAGPGLTWLRGARDGVIGLFDAVTDLQLGLFSDASMLLADVLMASSDLVGVVDDNPVSQYVFKAVASKSLAKTAYLFHLAGAEAVLGSHGLEKEWYVEAALIELNPLLDGDSGDPGILLDPLDFLDDRMLHVAVYRSHVPGAITLTSIGADGVLRPLSCLLRIAGLRKPADELRSTADGWMRQVVE